MEKIDPKVHIPRRVELTPEEVALIEEEQQREKLDWERYQDWRLHPEAFIYAKIFQGEYRHYEGCSLDNCPHGKQIARWLEEGTGLYIWGGVGVGKTYLALSCLKWQLAHRRKGFIWTADQVLDNLRYFVGLHDANALEMQIASYCGLPMLIIDDFGVQATTAWADEQLYEVINRRWLRKDSLMTIVTSNLPPEEIELKAKDELVGARIVSRLLDMCRVLHIIGEDRRLDLRGRLMWLH